jgi:ABC-type sugar transport system permease subunit
MSNVIKFEDGEKIMKVVRKHYFVLLPAVFMLLVLAFAPYILHAFFHFVYFQYGRSGGVKHGSMG